MSTYDVSINQFLYTFTNNNKKKNHETNLDRDVVKTVEDETVERGAVLQEQVDVWMGLLQGYGHWRLKAVR